LPLAVGIIASSAGGDRAPTRASRLSGPVPTWAMTSAVPSSAPFKPILDLPIPPANAPAAGRLPSSTPGRDRFRSPGPPGSARLEDSPHALVRRLHFAARHALPGRLRHDRAADRHRHGPVG